MIKKIKVLALKEKIYLKRHAILRVYERGIAIDELQYALKTAVVVEEYPKDYPFPSFLVLGYTNERKPLHAVVSVDPDFDILWVITAYQPDVNEWEKDYKRRKK